MTRRFVIAAGGTGGHVIPALEIAAELRDAGAGALFVGTERGLEKRLVPRAGHPIEYLRVGPLKRVSWARRLRGLAELPASVWAAARILRRERPPAVLSLGGYASGPVAAAAVCLRIPLIVMEPNAYPGLANRLAARFVKRAMLGFEEARRYFPSGRSRVVGVPVRREFFSLPRKIHVGPATVFVTGGSQGARSLNRAAVEAARRWARDGFPGGLRLLHQTGSADYNGVRAEYQSLQTAPEIRLEAVEFIDDMPAAFAAADLVVCRSGASAVAELCAAGKASLLIPFPHAADNHQFRNAEAMARAGAARLIPDSEWNGERMVREIGAVMGAPGRLEAMEEASRKLARPDAAREVARELLDLSEPNERKS